MSNYYVYFFNNLNFNLKKKIKIFSRKNIELKVLEIS